MLATPVVLWAGWPFFVRGWQSLVTRSLNMFTLIALGTGRRLGLQRRRDARARHLPGRLPRATTARSPVYFEAAAVITVLVLLGQVLELRARESDERRHPGAARPRAEDRAPHPRRTATEEDVPLDAGACRRPAARAPRREGAGRRRRRRGPQRRRRVDGHRRADAGRRRSPATNVDRRHGQPDRRARHRGAQGRARHDAGADRADGRRGAAQPRADPAAGRPGVGLVRAGGDRGRAARLRRPGRSGARSRASPTRWSPRSRC